MIVSERMTRRVASIARDATLRQAAEEMCRHRVGSLLVFEGHDLRGIVTERDVLKAVGGGDVDATVRDLMTTDPETIEADASIDRAAFRAIAAGAGLEPVCAFAFHYTAQVFDDDALASWCAEYPVGSDGAHAAFREGSRIVPWTEPFPEQLFSLRKHRKPASEWNQAIGQDEW